MLVGTAVVVAAASTERTIRFCLAVNSLNPYDGSLRRTVTEPQVHHMELEVVIRVRHHRS